MLSSTNWWLPICFSGDSFVVSADHGLAGLPERRFRCRSKGSGGGAGLAFLAASWAGRGSPRSRLSRGACGFRFGLGGRSSRFRTESPGAGGVLLAASAPLALAIKEGELGRTISAELRQTGSSTGRGEVRRHSVVVDRPTAKGGADEGPMGGELVLLGLGGCFLSNLLAAIRARNAEISDVRVLVEATIDEAPERFSRFTIRVFAEHRDRADLEKLATIAERGCLVANTLRSATPIEVVVEGS
jgi:putative redox protein